MKQEDATSLCRGISPIEIGFIVTSTELIVLIVRDGGLRSALIAHLSLQGESLVTLDTYPEDPIIQRLAPPPRILVIDKPALGDRLQPLVDNNHWGGIIVLADEAEETAAGDRLSIIHQRRALVDVIETLARWRVPAL